jgi:hypothetical protein
MERPTLEPQLSADRGMYQISSRIIAGALVTLPPVTSRSVVPGFPAGKLNASPATVRP